MKERLETLGVGHNTTDFGAELERTMKVQDRGCFAEKQQVQTQVARILLDNDTVAQLEAGSAGIGS